MKITRIDIWCTKIVQIKITALNTIKIQIKITCLIMMTERFLKGKNGIKALNTRSGTKKKNLHL